MTTSKRRRKAREWMQDSLPKKVHQTELAVAKETSYREGSRAMERDMTELQARVYEKYLEEGRIQCTRAVVDFPDGRKDPRPRRIKVAMPFSPSPRFGFGYVPQSVQFVEFMPILCSVTQQFDEQRCSLEWVQWAPNIAGGGEENELNGLKYTRAMTMARGKISHAANLLRDVCMRRFYMRASDDSTISEELGKAMPELMKAGQLVDDAAEELRLELGKFAPDEGPHRWLSSGMDQWPPFRSPW